jgi:hypothetical protein
MDQRKSFRLETHREGWTAIQRGIAAIGGGRGDDGRRRRRRYSLGGVEVGDVVVEEQDEGKLKSRCPVILDSRPIFFYR